ncbi:MAG: 3-hydroxyacyl-CoA dehydrogenase family protein [Lachnospiraceae bacterium]|nr:3-hydroxyacyl-CoA dehydrogenase family protein [Lachnospiraceae bacterium]
MADLKKFAVIGGGMMGSAIAQVLASIDGASVIVRDIFDIDIKAKVRGNMKLLVEHGVVTEQDVEDRVAKIEFTKDINDPRIADAELLIEGVLEDMKLKQDTFAELEKVCRPDCIFCTNTSVMSPTEIYSKIEHKERACGTHFWNPGYLIPLVEVVKTVNTSDEVINTVVETLAKAGKKPVVCKKDVPGFIANRMQHALWREAISIVENGIADAETVDIAVKNSFGLRLPQLAPLENSDMVGTQLTYNIHNYVLNYIEDSHKPSPLLQQMIDEGKFGFRAEDGQGFYKWDEESKKKANDDLSTYLIRMLYGK